MDSLKQEKEKLHQQLQDYGNNVGFEHSTYIKREHGEDFSLMTEIVVKQSNKPCFP